MIIAAILVGAAIALVADGCILDRFGLVKRAPKAA
jgi:hypothetical protein